MQGVPDGPAGEPHRALVETVLANQRRHREWMVDGGPVPELPGYWGALWKAAVQRHIALTDLPESDATDAVRSIVSQLGTLHGSAAWFRDDSRLRELAITETLLHGTGLSDRVTSREAQLAWPRRDGTQQWLDAWTAWTTSAGRGGGQ